MTTNQVISIFPRWGHFPHKFSIAPSGQTTDRIKKVRKIKMARIFSITMQSMVEIVGRAPAVDEKVWCIFCLFLSGFGTTKFAITETLWNSVIFKTYIMMSLHRGRFVVVHLYSTFSVDPHNFPLGANLYHILPFFAIFMAHFKATTVKFGMGVWTRDSLPSQIL